MTAANQRNSSKICCVRNMYQCAGGDGVIEWRQVGILADAGHEAQ